MQKILSLVGPIIAIILGIVVVVAGVHKLSTKDLYDSTAQATVVDVQEEIENDGEDTRTVTKVFIDYEVDGVKYEHVEAPESDSTMQIGDTVEILYQSKNPSEYSGKIITGNAAILIAIGAVVALAGIFVEIKTIIRK